jgi:hypothetical protein
MTWKGKLIGGGMELEALRRLCPAPPIHIVREGEPYYLVSTEVESETDHHEVLRRYDVLVTRLNTAGLLKCGSA